MKNFLFNLNPLENHPLDNPDKGSVGYFRVVPADMCVTNQLLAKELGTKKSIKKLESITGKAEKMAKKVLYGKLFFTDNLLGQAYFKLHLNRCLNSLVAAYQQQPNQTLRQKYLHQSLKELELASAQLKMAEHDVFSGWYSNDTKFGLQKIEKRLRVLTRGLDKH